MRASTAVSMRPILSMIALALALFGAASARADENDPPTRAARLAYIEGSVSFNPAGTQDWVAPPVNRPLTTGDQLWADRGGRAELQLDGSSLRMGASTSMAFLNLSDHVTQVQLSAGTLSVHVRQLYDQETYEIDTPNLAFTVLRPGTYRISVDADAGTTTINVRRGQGEVSGGGTAYSLYEGEDDVFSGTDQLTETAQYQSPAPDSLDAWSDGRDNRWENSRSARYVSPDVVGYQDLDDHGTWSATREYGNVWIPRGVEPGWAPYQSGHWAYVPPWGYTWVDDQPWGFAPFHYGRWIYTGQAWGWVPAPPPGPDVVYVRPVYAPALVAWVEVGAAIAWFALGPREVYVPSYPVSRGYVNAVNVSNTTVNTTIVNNVYNTTVINNNVTNITYVNRTAPGAIVGTTPQVLASGAHVARNRLPIDARAVAAAPVRALPPPVVPTRQAVLGPSRPAAARPPATVTARPVVARTPPPPPPPSVEQHLRALQNNGGRPLSVAQVRQLAPLPAAAHAAPVKLAPPAKTLITPKSEAAAPRPAAEVANRAAEANRPAPAPPAHPAPAPPARSAPPPPEHPAPAPPPRSAPPPPEHPAPAPPARPAPAITHVSEMPPAARPRPPGEANSTLERQHLQEQQRLQAQQVAERQRIQQQQEAEHQRLLQQQADQARQRQLQAQIEQQHRQQTQELQQRHALEQQQIAERQQEQRRQQQVQPAPARPAAAPPRQQQVQPAPPRPAAAPPRQPPNDRPAEPPRR